MYQSESVSRLDSYFREAAGPYPKKWSLFFARYRLVSEIQGLKFHSLKGLTAEGYELALKVGLAHTALEALQNALEGDHVIVVRDARASRILRGLRNTQFEDFLVKSCKSRNLKARVEAMFASQKPMDLIPLVEAVRNSVFHGGFTPHSSMLTRNPDVRILFDLIYLLIIDKIEAEILEQSKRIGLNFGS